MVSLLLLVPCLLHGCLVVPGVFGVSIKCVCTTKEPKEDQVTTCTASYACYVEVHATGNGDRVGPVLRGCIDDRTPLLCENRRPINIKANVTWPVLLCCTDQDFCNRGVMPTLPLDTKTTQTPKPETQKMVPDCRDSSTTVCAEPAVYPVPDEQASQERRTINPMYIAVPVAGVCVLLALIIFALYLLRKRNNHYNFHSPIPSLGGRGVTGEANSEKTNRCLDSERSSSGSETKLFL